MNLFNHLENLWSKEELSPSLVHYLQTSLSKKAAIAAPRWPYAQLPTLCCEEAGCTADIAQPVTLAWASFYLAAHWLDDITDGDIQTSEQGQYLTLAVACISSASLFLEDLEKVGVSFNVAQSIRKDFYHTTLICCSGQILSLQQDILPLTENWRVVKEKTGQAYSLACRLGARLAGSNDEIIALFATYGLHLGFIIQISDDIHGLRGNQERKSDLDRNSPNLPLAYFMEVSSRQEQRKMLNLLQLSRSSTKDYSESIQKIIKSGALIYLIAEAQIHYNLAKEALQKAVPNMPANNQLLKLLEKSLPFQLNP